MQKGTSGLLVIILIAFLISLPATIWVISKSLIKASNVKGAATVEEQFSKPGFSVNIVSKSLGGGWDLVEYVCRTLDECTSSATSGLRWASVGGGGGDDAAHKVVVVYSPDLADYSHIKLIVKSGWGDSLKPLKVVTIGDVPGVKQQSLTSDGITYDVVVFPLTNVKDNFYTAATFSE